MQTSRPLPLALAKLAAQLTAQHSELQSLRDSNAQLQGRVRDEQQVRGNRKCSSRKCARASHMAASRLPTVS
jgi:hypothetical protein